MCLNVIAFPLLNTQEPPRTQSDQSNYSEVVSFIVRKYKGQRRRFSYEPYSAHPIRVADIVREYTTDQNVILASFLCFTIKLTNTTVEEIQGIFGKQVAAIVSEISPHPSKVKNRVISNDALLIVLADRLDNLLCFRRDSDILSGGYKQLARLVRFSQGYRRETKAMVNRLPQDHLTNHHKELIEKIRAALD